MMPSVVGESDPVTMTEAEVIEDVTITLVAGEMASEAEETVVEAVKTDTGKTVTTPDLRMKKDQIQWSMKMGTSKFQ